ncbi:hypothetical protein BASA60_010292 [Batrachochytrium salamandrivorans]|nr:hypothetical protein BASA60_010292 [Batrachochytrium salamandrivorans]
MSSIEVPPELRFQSPVVSLLNVLVCPHSPSPAVGKNLQLHIAKMRLELANRRVRRKIPGSIDHSTVKSLLRPSLSNQRLH